ncbi:hypothetical protein C6376_10340 [Streptomyces sp. P3]|nr:hypothetical protein C6376_10340 [Streptomyces sp. P3]
MLSERCADFAGTRFGTDDPAPGDTGGESDVAVRRSGRSAARTTLRLERSRAARTLPDTLPTGREA